MNFGSAADPALIVAAACGLLLAAAAITAGTQIVRSAGKANAHLARAAVLGATSTTEATNVAGGSFGARVGSVRDAVSARARVGQSLDDSPHQIFALLSEYYAANINAGNTIFWASLLSMVAGFAIIFAGLVSARTNTTEAILTTGAGILTQFISATFLVALRSTQQQSTSYAQNLVELHLRDVRGADDARAIALGLQLLDEIAGDGAHPLSDTTRAALALGLILKQPRADSITPVPAAVDDVPNATAYAVPSEQPRTRVESVSGEDTRSRS